MYLYYSPEEKFKLSVLAVGLPFFDKLKERTIKGIAEIGNVSEKQLHQWKNKLKEEGPKVFCHFTPGRKKKEFSFFPESERLLIYEIIYHFLIDGKKAEGKNRKFPAADKENFLSARERLKQEFGLTYETFSNLIGLDSGSLRLWSRKVKEEGKEGLKNKSSAPKRMPGKLHPALIREIIRYGGRWKRRHRKIRIGEFSIYFRYKYRRLLRKFGKNSLSDKVISRYLKDAGLYQEKEERPKGKRGNFRYYFPGAQSLIDTSVIFFLGVKMKLIAVMDGFSRFIFHQEGFLNEKADKIISVMKSSLKNAEKKGLKVLSFLSDHGKPYKSKRVMEYLKKNGILRNFSSAYWPEGKAPIERYFRTVKEELSSKGRLIYLFLKGSLIWIKAMILKELFNLILLGLTDEYNRTKNLLIDGKSPQERVRQQASYQFQQATEKVLQEEERISVLKNELVDSLCKEFGWKEKKKVKGYLFRFRKETINQAAEALRRKLVIEDLPSENRWRYLSKVSYNIEKKKQEEEVARARRIIRTEQMKAKEEEEKKKIEEERRWHQTHPEFALEKAVEWYLLLCNCEIGRGYYQREIICLIEKILNRHSILTTGKKIEKICERIKKKEMLPNVVKNKIGSNSKVPTSVEIDNAKEKIITLIKGHNFLEKQNIPAIQNLKRIYLR